MPIYCCHLAVFNTSLSRLTNYNADHVFDSVITTAVTWIRRPVGRCYNLLVMHQFTSLCMWKTSFWCSERFRQDLALSVVRCFDVWSGSVELCRDLGELDDTSGNDLVELYSRVLTELLDKHSPSVTAHHRRDKQAMPWFNADCCATQRWTRAAGRCYRLTHSSADMSAWSRELHTLRQLKKVNHTVSS